MRLNSSCEFLQFLACILITLALGGCAGPGSRPDEPPSSRRGVKNVYVMTTQNLYVIDPTQGQPGKMIYVQVGDRNSPVYFPLYRINKINGSIVDIDNSKKYGIIFSDVYYCDYTADYISTKKDLKGCTSPNRTVDVKQISNYKSDPYLGEEPSTQENGRCYGNGLTLSEFRIITAKGILHSPSEFSVDESQFGSIIATGRRNAEMKLAACAQAQKIIDSKEKTWQQTRRKDLDAFRKQLKTGDKTSCGVVQRISGDLVTLTLSRAGSVIQASRSSLEKEGWCMCSAEMAIIDEQYKVSASWAMVRDQIRICN